MRSLLSAGLAVILAGSALLWPANFVFAQEDQDVGFVANMEMIRGHLNQAVANKENNALDLAHAHATHPIAELYSLVELQIQSYSEQSSTQLGSALTDLSAKVDTLSAAEFKAEADRIASLLDDAQAGAVPAAKLNDTRFNAQVINSLLSTSVGEYSEGVKDGSVIATVEYQDGQAFMARAQDIYGRISGQLPEQQRGQIDVLFDNLTDAIGGVRDPQEVKDAVNSIIDEMSNAAGLDTTSGPATTSAEYVQTAKALLSQISAEYRNSNFTGADKLAVVAYLENFEYVEPELVKAGSKDLSDEIEQMMRVELRDMIKNQVPQQQLDDHISAIDSKLDQAIAVVPEFPMGAVAAMAGVVGLVVIITRMQGRSLFDR